MILNKTPFESGQKREQSLIDPCIIDRKFEQVRHGDTIGCKGKNGKDFSATNLSCSSS